MLAEQILLLLKKISGQLDEIAQNQNVIKEEIFLLHQEFMEFQENTLKNLEASFSKFPPESMLN